MNRTLHAAGTPAATTMASAGAIPSAPVDDLDALIAAAERRVIQRDRRVLRHGEQLKQRLASHGTQARLGALGVAGVAALVLWSRHRRSRETPAPARGSGHRPSAAEHASAASWWVVWLPVLLQLFTAGTTRPARPPGLAGVASMLFSLGRQWAGRQSTGLRAAAPPPRPPRPPRNGVG